MLEKCETINTENYKIVTEEMIHAHRNVVFDSLTDAKHISQWWGPRGFTTTTEEMSAKPGGVWKFNMRGPDGTDYPNYILYSNIIKNEYLAYEHGSTSDLKNDPHAFMVEIKLVSIGHQTKVTMTLIGKNKEQFEEFKKYNAIGGSHQTLQRLDEYLLSPDSFVITRIFEAPRDLVFKVWTEEKHFKNWFSPKGSYIDYLKSDIREGGMCHYCLTHHDQKKMWGEIIYLQLFKSSRLVFLQYFSDEAGNRTRHPMNKSWPLEMLTTIIFEESDKRRTKLTLMWTPINANSEEKATFEKGKIEIEQSWNGTFDQLSEYLKKLLRKNIEVSFNPPLMG